MSIALNRPPVLGRMNALMIMKTAGASDVEETAYIKGMTLRSDGDEQSTIFDLDGSTAVDSAGNKADFTVDLKVEPTGCRGVPANPSR